MNSFGHKFDRKILRNIYVIASGIAFICSMITPASFCYAAITDEAKTTTSTAIQLEPKLNKATKTSANIAIIQLIEHPALDATRQGILDTLKVNEKNYAFDIDFQSAQGNSILATQIAQKYASKKPDVMVGIGTIATQALITANKQQALPVVFSSVSDPQGANMLRNLLTPEGMVTGVSNFVDPNIQFELFKRLIPTLKTVGIIYNPGEPNSVSLVESMKAAASKQNLQLNLAAANNSAEVAQAANQLIASVQAIFINSDNTALSAFDAIVNISNKSKIPVFCSDNDMLNHGAFVTVGANQYEIGKQTGDMIMRILAGEPLKRISVEFPHTLEINIDAAVASKLNIEIPSDLMKYVLKR